MKFKFFLVNSRHYYSMAGLMIFTIGLSSTLHAQTNTQQPSSPSPTDTPSSPSSSPSNDPKNGIEILRKHPRLEKVYTWKDANGVTHITNTPPTDIVSNKKEKLDPELITITGDASQESKTYADRLKEFENQQSETQKKDEEALQKKRLDAQAKLQCDQLKGRMTLYQSDREIRKVGSDGKDQVVSDSARQDTLNSLRDSYSALCR